MVETLERRRVPRLAVPSHLGGFEVESRLVRLLDLSAEGARIEHPGHLHEGLLMFVDLPPALGGARLTGEVMWTKFGKSEQTVAGDKHVSYQSGLAFVGITPEQQTALAGALAILKMAGSPAGA
jgi:PilZ domain-containing protein